MPTTTATRMSTSTSRSGSSCRRLRRCRLKSMKTMDRLRGSRAVMDEVMDEVMDVVMGAVTRVALRTAKTARVAADVVVVVVAAGSQPQPMQAR